MTTSNTTRSPEQLTLLTPADVPVQFRLDAATRERGLRHIAEIRARLERARPGSGGAAPPGKRPDRAA
jgi:hypothetical protein